MAKDDVKPMLGARVPKDTEHRFEEYRQERDLNKSDAVRRLIEAGLDEIEAEREEHRQDARTQTSAEEWCSEKFRSWAGTAILSGVGFTFLFLVFMVDYVGWTTLPQWALSAAMLLFLLGFIVFGGGALVIWLALRSGFARNYAQEQEAASEVEA